MVLPLTDSVSVYEQNKLTGLIYRERINKKIVLVNVKLKKNINMIIK